jgi:predicted naringenin-chalcone synthase
MMITGASPAILALGTAVPRHRVDQAALCEWLAVALGNQPAMSRWLRALYRASGIQTRYSCLEDAERAPSESRFAPSRPPEQAPSTAERMALYEREAPLIAEQAARSALAEYAAACGETVEAAAQGITHLIVVSCTGFFAPGLDLAVAQRLGLRANVERTIIGFMGCAAAFNALRLADRAARSQPDARVLVVCAELCSIHAQPTLDRVNLTVSSLFADGAAVCVVGQPDDPAQERFELDGFLTHFVPDTTGDMAWRIGNHGFRMNLSPAIPRMLGEVAPQALEELLAGRPRPNRFAIHPGGRSIVDQVELALGLTPAQVAPSREVLRQYGNMSSPTILFVLRELREALRAEATGASEPAIAMAFGPGLVAELAHLTYVPGPALDATLARTEAETIRELRSSSRITSI